MKIELEPVELATILAALRFWQGNVDDDEKIDLAGYGHFTVVKPLPNNDIDNLCEKINV